MTKYEIINDGTTPRIEAVDVVREDDDHIYLATGRRRRKGSGVFALYHDTWAEARDCLRSIAIRRMETKQASMIAAERFFAAVSVMKPPAPVTVTTGEETVLEAKP